MDACVLVKPADSFDAQARRVALSMICPAPVLPVCSLLILLGSLAMLVSPGLAWGQAQPTHAGSPIRPELICAADRPLLHPGESVVVRGWVVGAPDEPAVAAPTWRWQTDLGRIDGAEVATWQFGPGDLPKEGTTVTATAEVAVAGRPEALLRCEVDVVLTERREPAGDGLRGDEITAHAFLLNGQPPPRGYGMYSYVLLDAPANDTERRRHINAIAQFLVLIPSAIEMNAHRQPANYNLSLLPVKRDIKLPQHQMSAQEAQAMAAEVLKHYDFGHALLLMRAFCVDVRGSGPYLVAARDSDCRRSRLLLDLTQTQPELVHDWIRTFRSLATAERSWGNDTMAQLMLKTRNVIAVSASGMTTAAQDLSRWVRILQ